MSCDFNKPGDTITEEKDIIKTNITNDLLEPSNIECANNNTEDTQVTGIWSVIGCVARTASAIVMLTTFLGLFINPIRTIIHLIKHLDVTIWRAILLEIVLFCFFAISPSLDECAGSILRPTDRHISNKQKRKQKILALVNTMIIFSLYVISIIIVI